METKIKNYLLDQLLYLRSNYVRIQKTTHSKLQLAGAYKQFLKNYLISMEVTFKYSETTTDYFRALVQTYNYNYQYFMQSLIVYIKKGGNATSLKLREEKDEKSKKQLLELTGIYENMAKFLQEELDNKMNKNSKSYKSGK